MASILVCHPGASTSTSDVHAGLSAGLKARGHTIYDYALDGRIQVAAAWLHYCWKKSGKKFDRPGPSDTLYQAGQELVTRALRVQPDLVLIVSAMYLHPDVLVLMKRAGLKIAVLFTESPYDDEQQAKLLPFIDVAWTNERSSAKAMGIYYLPHACNAAVHTPDISNPAIPAHDVVFVGTGFEERIETLSAVDWTGINLGLYGSWNLLGSRNALRKYVCGGYINNAAQTVQLYRAAKIGLNLYRTSKGFGTGAPKITHAESLNPRAYELAAIGCFTISDERLEVTQRFGEKVPTFRHAHELRPLVDTWLADDAGRARIKMLLPQVVTHDTWLMRAAQVEADLIDKGLLARADANRSAAVGIEGTREDIVASA